VVENIAVIVKSSFIAEGMRCIFAMLWDMAGQTTSEKNQALRRRATR